MRKLVPDAKPTAFNWGIPYVIAKEENWFSTQIKILLASLSHQEFVPMIGNIVPLSEAASAHALIESGKSRGKILLDCPT